MIYYNEFDPDKVIILKQLIADGLLPAGDVDSRSIKDVKAHELKQYTQCHFFAGVGLWALSLELAAWGDRPVWTGSCPCQPFSIAGKKKAKADDRHLWPEWRRLISECKPPTIFGEQVEGAITDGWLDEVGNDLEGHGYAFGPAVLPACSVGKAHKRYRIFFVGYAEHHGWDEGAKHRIINGGQEAGRLQQLERSNTPGGNETFITRPNGKRSPIKPGISMLVNEHPGNVPIIHAVGDGIQVELATQFIKAAM